MRCSQGDDMLSNAPANYEGHEKMMRRRMRILTNKESARSTRLGITLTRKQGRSQIRGQEKGNSIRWCNC